MDSKGKFLVDGREVRIQSSSHFLDKRSKVGDIVCTDSIAASTGGGRVFPIYRVSNIN
jgi:hypothetical protein